MDNPFVPTLLVAKALEAVGTAYCIGGSLASGIYGLGRATMDADLVAPLQEGQIDSLLKILGQDFYADADMIREAIRLRRSFNVIHLPTMFKVDVFIPGSSPHALEQIKRRRLETLDPITGESAYFAAPEDIILAKLNWYIKSGHSERQWQDILGIIKTQGLRLDLAYLKHWAETLGLRDELRRALADGELPD